VLTAGGLQLPGSEEALPAISQQTCVWPQVLVSGREMIRAFPLAQEVKGATL
jgi:hypothetical protein